MKIILCVIFIFGKSLSAQSQDNYPKDTSYSVYSAYQKLKKDYPFIKIVTSVITENVQLKKDLVYKTYPNRKMHLDLFLPSDIKDKLIPVVILIHGGGWKSGNRSMMHPLSIKLATKGYITAVLC